MSKEELLKYLIAEIDLIMHDKDYRFENANGTWYSRESCRDLTNEEVFEELRTELRQFADLEAKLAEKQKENATLEAMLVENANDRKTMQEFKIGEDEYDLTDEDARNSLCWEVEELKQQLAEKDREIEYYKKQAKKLNSEAQKYFEDTYCNDSIYQDKISFALEQVEQIRKEFEIKLKGCKWEDKMLVGKFCNITNEIIDNTINVLRNNKDGIH